MPFNEALFWFGIAALGVGPFFIFEGGMKQMYGIGLTVIGALACAYSVYRHYHPEAVRPIPLWMILWVLTWALLGYDIYLRRSQSLPVAGISITPTSVADMPTYLRLQFNAVNTVPVGLEKGNVWRWYALRTTIEGLDIKTKKPIKLGAWTIFITFDKPISFMQTQIDGAGSVLPTYEVKDSSQRSAVVWFSGELVNTVVNIRFTN